MSQIVRIGPQDARKPVSINPGDTIEVALPERSVSGTWRVNYDRAFFWDEEEETRQARWVLADANQQTVRTLLSLAQGRSIIHCEYVDLQNGHGRVLESVDFYVYIGIAPSQQKKFRPSEKTAALSQAGFRPPPREDYAEIEALPLDPEERTQHLESENRRLQERLWDLTNKVVELAEGYARIVKGKTPPRRA